MKGDGMAEVTSADREKAAKITGCKREVSRYDAQFVYCGEHDGLGNPEWDSCLWVPVAAALAEEREKARAPFLALAEQLDQRPYNLTAPVVRVVADAIRRAAEQG